MAKNTHYVVWEGRKPGIYTTWPQAEAQVKGFKGAKFKGFPCQNSAEIAFKGGPSANTANTAKKAPPARSGLPTGTFLTVDAAFSGKTHVLEWRGVLVEGNKQTEVFRSSPYQGGSANVGEYLALVQGIQFLIDQNKNIPIYSDSYNAQKWVQDKGQRSNVEVSSALKTLMMKADNFLILGGYSDFSGLIKIRDWKSREWGDIPADFYRKGRSSSRIPDADSPAL